MVIIVARNEKKLILSEYRLVIQEHSPTGEGQVYWDDEITQRDKKRRTRGNVWESKSERTKDRWIDKMNYEGVNKRE